MGTSEILRKLRLARGYCLLCEARRHDHDTLCESHAEVAELREKVRMLTALLEDGEPTRGPVTK